MPEAVPNAGAGGAHAHARTDTRGPRRVVPLKQPTIGKATRERVDEFTADAAGSLAQQLTPGLCLRIERLQPRWCAGWLEDFPLDSGELGELYEYLADEYGGKVYKVTAIDAGNNPLWSSRVNVAGPPRHAGRVVTRAQWEGEPDGAAPAAPTAAPAVGNGLGDTLAFLKLVLDQNDKASAAQLEAVREAVNTSKESTTELMQLLVQERADERKSQSLGGQLADLVESSKAIQKVGKFFGAADGDSAAEERGVLQGAADEAMGHFVEQFVTSQFGQKGEESRPRVRRARPAPKTGIPEAIPRG